MPSTNTVVEADGNRMARPAESPSIRGAGFEGVSFKGLRCPTATSIADVPEAQLLPIIRDELNGPDAEAVVQIGTNLSMVRLSDEAESGPNGASSFAR